MPDLMGQYYVPGRRQIDSPLAVALDTRQQDLALLLLANGYRIGLEPWSPLTTAISRRAWDVVELLLRWGASPAVADPETVLNSYDIETIERFWSMGLDYTDQDCLAWYLSKSTRNRPAYGWAPILKWKDDSVPDEEQDCCNAIELAVDFGVGKLLRALRPIPDVDDLDQLFASVCDPDAVDFLAAIRQLTNWSPTILRNVYRITNALLRVRGREPMVPGGGSSPRGQAHKPWGQGCLEPPPGHAPDDSP